ncbi:MAG: glycosyltransferase family 87 protein [Gemmataceae bacterium]
MPRPSLRWAIAIWTIVFVVIGTRIGLSKRVNSVYPIFSEAGRRWEAGQPLYIAPTPELDQFRYTPIVAAAFAPWGHLSDRTGAILWLVLTATLFVGSFIAWWRDSATAGVALLLAIPISLGSINNGQCNAIVMAMSLIALLTFQRERWGLAAIAVSIAVLLKIYPLALGLLLTIVEPRRFGLRFALAIVAGLALPYLLAPPDYVTDQYRALVSRVHGDDRTVFPIVNGYRDLQMLTRVVGMPLTRPSYQIVELLVAVACAGLVAVARLQGQPREQIVWTCGALASCWMTVFGPATESSTYIILAPWLAYACARAMERPRWWQIVAFTSYGLFTFSMALAWFPGSVRDPLQATGVMPLAGLLLTIVLVGECMPRQRLIADSMNEPRRAA